ncbi:MAG: FHA domain-containing protein [Synechococcus sp.]
MDTLNDWTEDGCETQLVALDSSNASIATQLLPHLQSSFDSVEEHNPDTPPRVPPAKTPSVSADTHIASQATPLVSADSTSKARIARSSLEILESNSPQSPRVPGEPKAEIVLQPPTRLTPNLQMAEVEFPAKTSEASNNKPEISQSFLDYFLTYPIIKNLIAADLLDKQELLEAARIWKQMGGKLEHVLVDRMGIKSTTIKFFHNSEAGTSAKQQGCKRIGEFLRAAGLVSEGEIQFVLDELKTQGRTLKLGDALVEQGLVKQSTIDYFANRFINDDRNFEAHASGDDSESDYIDDDSHFRVDEFFFVLGQHGQFSSHTLRARMYSIGRAAGNDIVVNDRFVSRRHAYLIRTQDKETQTTTYEVLDCGKVHEYSTNGIYVNGKKVKHQALKAGDVVHIGPKIQARFLPVE